MLSCDGSAPGAYTGQGVEAGPCEQANDCDCCNRCAGWATRVCGRPCGACCVTGRCSNASAAWRLELARSLPQLQDSRQVRELKLMRRLLLDERVPLWQKAIPVAAAVYLVSPLDLIPDVIPVVGQLDDLAVLLGSMRLFRSLVPPALIEEHLAYIDGEVVDAPGWRAGSLDAR